MKYPSRAIKCAHINPNAAAEGKADNMQKNFINLMCKQINRWYTQCTRLLHPSCCRLDLVVIDI